MHSISGSNASSYHQSDTINFRKSRAASYYSEPNENKYFYYQRPQNVQSQKYEVELMKVSHIVCCSSTIDLRRKIRSTPQLIWKIMSSDLLNEWDLSFWEIDFIKENILKIFKSFQSRFCLAFSNQYLQIKGRDVLKHRCSEIFYNFWEKVVWSPFH